MRNNVGKKAKEHEHVRGIASIPLQVKAKHAVQCCSTRHYKEFDYCAVPVCADVKLQF